MIYSDSILRACSAGIQVTDIVSLTKLLKSNCGFGDVEVPCHSDEIMTHLRFAFYVRFVYDMSD